MPSNHDQHGLTPREVETLRLIVCEQQSKQIADWLCITKKTVDKHRQSLYKKAKTDNPLGLLRFALNKGYISLAEWLLITDNLGTDRFTLPLPCAGRGRRLIDVLQQAHAKGAFASPESLAAETGYSLPVARWLLDNV